MQSCLVSGSWQAFTCKTGSGSHWASLGMLYPPMKLEPQPEDVAFAEAVASHVWLLAREQPGSQMQHVTVLTAWKAFTEVSKLQTCDTTSFWVLKSSRHRKGGLQLCATAWVPKAQCFSTNAATSCSHFEVIFGCWRQVCICALDPPRSTIPFMPDCHLTTTASANLKQ